MLGENGPRTECRIPAELHRHLYLFFLKKQKKNLKISQKLLVSQRSNIGVGAAVLVVWCQQRASGAAPCNSCTPHTHSHIVHWIATLSATVLQTLASSCRFTPPPKKKKLYFLGNSSLSSFVIRRAAAGAFSDPAVQWPLLYQKNNFRCL